MKLFFRVFVSFCFFFLLLFSGGKALALQTAEIFATSTSVSAWDSFSNLLGPPNSIYATKTTGTLGGYWYFSDSLNIPISATITSLVFKIYAQSSGNSSGMNGWSVYLSGVSCSSFPNISLGNGIRTVTVDATNCTGTNDFVDVVQAHKLTLNMSSLHVIGYPRSGISDRIYIWDSVGVYATYELPAPIPTPTPSNIDLTPGSVWEWPTATISATQKGGLVDVISVSAGQDHSLALTSDGVVWAWGSNSNGQLGNGAVGGFTAEPVRVKSPDGQGYLADIKAIAAGTKYSLALKNDGTVWTWGYNGYGARGTGLGVGYPYEEYRNLPLATQVQTSGGFSQIIAIAAGGYHSLALKSDGSVFTWGNNAQGQTGTGYSIYSSIVSSPKKVLNNVTSIAGGIYHSIVSKNDGTVWGSGRISAGQLGSVTNSWASGVGLPVQIPEIGGIKSVWAKGSASMALAEDNTVYEWGSGRWLPYDANPRQIPGLDDVRMISSGSYFTGYIGIALKSDGTVWMFDVQTLIAQQVPGFSNIGFVSGGSGGVPNLAVVKMSEPTPTPSPSPTPTPKTPLILIPGIAGSEFKSSETFLSPIKDCGTEPVFMYDINELIWINIDRALSSSCDDYFDVLKLKEDGYTPGFPQIVLNNKIFGESYDKTIKFFLDNGYELDETLFTFPYDWRLDISHTKELLDNLVNTIKIQTGSEKVDFVAHSMGGLVARNYISDAIKAPNVRKLFTLGTPYLGAVNSLKILMYGECLTSWHLELSPICFGIKNSETKDIAQNMISMYEITPSKKYFDFYTGKDRYQPLPYKINDEVLNYNQIKNLLTSNGLNTSLFSPSETFHSLDENLSDTNGVDITIVAGSGYPTLGQIIEKKKIHLSGTTDNRKDIKIINGDKTVPLFSASLNDPSESRSISGNARVFYTNQSHGNLVTNSSALKLVKNIVEDNSQLPDGVSANAYSLPAVWWLLGVFSPVDIHAYDFLGNHTGLTTNGDFEANIPGSSYDTMDDAKFIFLPNDGIYNLRFEATGQGSFDFKIRKYEDDTIFQETLYKDIPLTASTKAETQFNTSSTESPIIHLDKDGNGTVDQDINSSSNLTGNEIFDQIPPQTNIQISGALGNNNWYRSDVLVTLIAEDEENGSGILKTEYSLDNGQTVNIYSQPFTISEEKINKLKFRSVDNAGNEEDPRETEIKIDKTAPQVAIDANPKILWPANSKMVDVIIAGSSFDTNPLSIRIAVDDEYNKIEPYITNFNQTIKLQAGRRGDDLDGRKYTLKAIGEDLAGNIEQASVEIVVPHDQGKSNRNFYLQLFETFSKLFR